MLLAQLQLVRNRVLHLIPPLGRPPGRTPVHSARLEVPAVTLHQNPGPGEVPGVLQEHPKLTMAAERVTLLQIELLSLHRQDDGNDPDPLMVLQQGAQLQWLDRYAQAMYAPAAYDAKEMLIPRTWLQP